MKSLVTVGTYKAVSPVILTRSLYQFSRSTTALQAVKVAKSKTTGAFKTNLPDTFPSQTHYKRALRALKLIKADYSVKNIRNQERKLTAQSMDALMKGLTVPISEILNAYTTTFRNLHPFEVRSYELLGLMWVVGITLWLRKIPCHSIAQEDSVSLYCSGRFRVICVGVSLIHNLSKSSMS